VADKPGDADEAEANEADKVEADEADAEVDEAVEAILDNAANEAIVANEVADSDDEADVTDVETAEENVLSSGSRISY